MTTQQDTEYRARARATLGAELGTLTEMLTTDQLDALATEVVTAVLRDDRGFSEYVTEYVKNITASSNTDADRLRKVRSYADLMISTNGDQAVTEDVELEVCTDCLTLIANGEVPKDDPEFSLLDEWDGWMLAINCDEDCEGGFSWSQCDGCGSTLGGDRHPVIAMKLEVSS